MPTPLVLAPLLLSVLLAVSAVAKLRDPGDPRAAFESLRVPRALSADWIVRSVPWVELALAVGLLVLPGVGFFVAALGAAGLFGIYLALVARALLSSADASCNCFGAATSGRVTTWTVARNALLLIASLVTLLDAFRLPRALVARIAGASADDWAWLGMALLVGATVFTVFYEGRPEPAEAEPVAPTPEVDADGDYVRHPIPYAQLFGTDGTAHTLRSLARQRAVLLVWVSMGCGGCQAIIPTLPQWAERLPMLDVRAVLADAATVDGDSPLRPLLLEDRGWNTGRLLEISGSPGAVVLGADGLLAGGPVVGASAVEDLVEGILEQVAEALAEAEPEASPAQA